jgi:hypothetical protein
MPAPGKPPWRSRSWPATRSRCACSRRDRTWRASFGPATRRALGVDQPAGTLARRPAHRDRPRGRLPRDPVRWRRLDAVRLARRRLRPRVPGRARVVPQPVMTGSGIGADPAGCTRQRDESRAPSAEGSPNPPEHWHFGVADQARPRRCSSSRSAFSRSWKAPIVDRGGCLPRMSTGRGP